MNKFNSIIIIVVLMLCYPLFRTDSWKSSTPSPKKYNKILVMNINNAHDSVFAGGLENVLVSNLKGLGYAAVSASNKYGQKGFENIREEETIKQLYPYDAVLTIALVNNKQKHCHVAVDSNLFFWEYYSDIQNKIAAPGYFTTGGSYYWEVKLYGLNDWKLLYTMRTMSFGPDFMQYFIKEYGKMIVSDMIINNILKAKDTTVLKPF